LRCYARCRPNSPMAQPVPMADLMEQSSVLHNSSRESHHSNFVRVMQTLMACMPLMLLVAGAYLAFRYHRQLRSSLSTYKQVPNEDPYGTFAAAGQGDGKRGKGNRRKWNSASLQGLTTPSPTPRVLGQLPLSASIDSLVSAASGNAPSVDSLPTIVGGVVDEREQRRATELMGETDQKEEEDEETRDREEERRLEEQRPIVKEDFSFDIPDGATVTESAAAGSVAAPALFDHAELPDLVMEAVTDDLPAI
jgi:hypothetical protein